MSYLLEVDRMLDQIRLQNRLRTIASDGRVDRIDFSSNDYLGLGSDSRVLEALRSATRAGSGGSRLLGGRQIEHCVFEDAISRVVNRDSALLFSSGYLAAAGVISILTRFVNVVYSDELNHASIIDALRASKVRREVYHHGALPPAKMRESPALIITESIFSMDGDSIDILGLFQGLNRDDILLVDEAHAIGVVGPSGGGLASPISDERVVVTGTLSKALGCQGGYVAGPTPLIDLLINVSRPFIFDTALSPGVAAAATRALDIAVSDSRLRSRLHSNVARLRRGLGYLGMNTGSNLTPIVPIILGDEQRALTASRTLAGLQIRVPAIRPPTVPLGTSRLRISMRATHSDDDIDSLLEGLSCIATS